MLRLRTATISDGDRLLAWRNDPVTRSQSLQQDMVDPAEHRRWLEQVLAATDRLLFIAEEDGIPVGTVRADWKDERYELSWTVAPEFRGRGVGTAMLAAAVAMMDAPVFAKIKVGNRASMRMAESLGWKQTGATGELTTWEPTHEGASPHQE